jgi:hypothetical protein
MEQKQLVEQLLMTCTPEEEGAFRAYLSDDPEHTLWFESGNSPLTEFRALYLGDFRDEERFHNYYDGYKENFRVINYLNHHYYFMADNE